MFVGSDFGLLKFAKFRFAVLVTFKSGFARNLLFLNVCASSFSMISL